MLGRIRAALKTARLPSARAVLVPEPRPVPADTASLVADFTRELDAIGVKSYSPAAAGDAIQLVIERVRARSREYGEAGRVELLTWADEEIPIPGLGEALRAAGFVRLDAQVPAEPEARRGRLAELGRAAVGVTGARAGLADTGTLVLACGARRPRLASLLPPVHIAILSRRALYSTMADFFAAEPELAREASNLVFITGPSRTADIEQTLTLGVHGPREVHVVLVE